MRNLFRPRNLVVLLIAIVGYGLWKYETFKGYYEFKQLCAKDSGLRVYEKVEKNVGWEAEDLNKATSYQRLLNHVAFVRSPNDKGELVDVSYKGGEAWGLDSSYNMPPADLSKYTRYGIKSTTHPEPGSRQLWKSVDEVTDLKTGKTAFRWVEYSYKWRHPDRPLGSLLGPSGKVQCPAEDEQKAIDGHSQIFEELNTNIFKE